MKQQKPNTLISRAAVMLLTVLMAFAGAQTAWATITGSGTSADPYVINTVNDWNTAAITQQYYETTNGDGYVYIKLGADLDFTNKTFSIYGTQASQIQASGYAHERKIRFDGQGHTISGITINRNSEEQAAIFGGLSAGGSISHLTVANSSFYAKKYVAGILAKNFGTVSDCHVESTVTLKVGDTYCGGIAAQNDADGRAGTVTGCTVAARLELPTHQYNSVELGGIVGYQRYSGTISNCLFKGSVEVYNGTSTFFGCITEYNNGTITGNCYCPVGNYHAFREGSDTDGAVAVSMVSGIPSGATVSSAATYTYGGNTYCAQNATTTITAGTNKVFSTFTATGATYSLANDKKSATVNLGTNDVTVSATIIPDPAHFAENSDGSYTIKTDIGWGLFCDALQDNATYNRFSGKTVKLEPTGNSNNITINRMAGSDSHDFCGTFDGQGNTLTFTSTENVDGVAPFSYVSETTPTGGSEVSHPVIRNLNVVADINTTATHASALVGRMWGTLTIKGCTVGGIIQTSNKYAAGVIAEQIGAASITDCVSSVTIKSSVSGDGTHGGFVAVPSNTLNITGSAFTGKLITTNGTNSCGGFVGWHNGKTVNITNSLYAPADPELGETAITDECATFVRGGGSVTNSYYTAALGEAQGKAPRSVTAGDQYVTTCTVSPKGSSTATYNLSGITAYNNGIIRDGTFYYGSGDQVSLTLAHSTRNGYTFNGYTPSAGTLNGTTLTMPDADVTIGSTWTANTYTVQFNGNGNTNDGTMTDQSFTYDEAQNLTANTYARVFTVTYNYNGATGGNSEGSATATATFNGWATTKSGAKVYDDNQSVSNLADADGATVTLYANWTDASVTLPTPTLTGHTFGGWYADSGLNNRIGDAGASYTPSTDITLYAKWTISQYTITFVTGTGGTVIDPITQDYDTPVTAPADPTREGYTFAGWNPALPMTMPTEDMTVTAQWTLIDWATESAGTEADPYVIYNNEQLDLLAQRVNSGTGDDGAANGYEGKYFVLGADIAYSTEGIGDTESNYTAIGGYPGDNYRSFRGHFDGQGHTVSGIRIYKAGDYGADSYQGLFGQTGTGASIQGIILADARITGYDNIGGIVGHNDGGTISDCHVAASVTIHNIQSDTWCHGGIVGGNYYGTVSDCTSAATLTESGGGAINYGGIAGENQGTLRHNLAIGAVVPAGNDNSHGAICGENKGILENNYYHACTVDGTANATGKGCYNDDITDNNGAVPAYVLTIGDGVSFLKAIAADLGFRYDSDGDGKAENYCPVGAKLTLNDEGYENGEYTVIKTANSSDITSSVLSGKVLTMPGYDITVNFSGKLIDWAKDGHNGTSTDPYMIYNKAQLDMLAQRVNSGTGDAGAATGYNGKFFKLGYDIAYSTVGIGATESNYTAIGNSGKPFCGHFDGQGHTVSGIRIYSVANSNQGLFGQTGTGACIQGIILADARITGKANTGGIVGYNGGTLSHNGVIGAVVAATADNTHGAICGANGGTLENNYYRDCTVADVENATGKGCNNANVDANNGAVPAYAVTLGEGVTIQTAMADDLGFSYDSDGDGQAQNYWREGAQLALAAPEGFLGSYTVNGADSNPVSVTENEGVNSFTMPASDVTVTAQWTAIPWSGTGTEDDPWVISYASQLDLLAQRIYDGTGDDDAASGYEGKYFVLGGDIKYSHTTAWNNVSNAENNYTAIGNNKKPFRGNFDGQGHAVSGIRIYKSGTSDADNYQGLFGQSGGNIRGITLADARITGYGYIGGIVGANSGTVSDCHVAASVTIHTKPNADYHGGIVGANSGTVSDCTSAATLTCPDGSVGRFYGGIAGENQGTLRHNLAIGAVVPAALYNFHGAICGSNGGTLENNYYRACTVAGTENATNVGCCNADATGSNGAVPAYAMTIDDGVSFLTAIADNLGFRYDSNDDGKAENYCPEGAQLTLNDAGYNNAIYTVIKTGDDSNITASVLSGNVLTMPGYDITVSFSGKLIDWADDGHSGTSADPYIICNKAQLLLLAYRVNGTHGETANTYSGKYFKLGADITFSYEPNEGENYAENYEAIGSYDGSNNYYFRGDFDGDGKTISGIRLRKTGNDNADSYQGLFGQIGDGANVHHVHLADARIKGYENIGGIVGLKSGGTVTGCTVTETAITATANYGTICGNNSNGTLTNNYYRHSTVNGNASGVGCQGDDVTASNGALPAYSLTLGGGATFQNAMAAELGFSYDSDGDGQAEDYWRKGAQLTLADLPTDIPEGCVAFYTVTQTADGTDITDTALSGTTLTVPYADVTVTFTQTAIPWDGSGTEDDPWVIIYPSQLDLLAQRVNSATGDCEDDGWGHQYYYKYKGKYFVLGADITYSHDDDANDDVYASNYTAIGGAFGNQQCYFSGHFDGQGHTVSGIRIYKGGDGGQGLFGIINGADVRGIILTDARITGHDSTGGIVGGNVAGTVSDCHVAADVYIHAVQSGAYYHGGITGGNSRGTISNCTSAATLTKPDDGNGDCYWYGGIAGFNMNGTLSHNLAIGAVVPATDTGHGAICGLTDGGTLENNYYHACKVASNDVTATGVGCGAIWDADNNELTAGGDTGAVPGIILYDHSSMNDLNSSILTTVGNAAVPRVALAGRTLWKDGDWNTLCLPFGLGDADAADGQHFDGTPLEGFTVMELDTETAYDNHVTGLDGTTLYLNFKDAKSITAGRPYIVRKDDTGGIENPVFQGVTVSTAAPAEVKSSDGAVSFTGSYSHVSLAANDKTVLYLGAANKLYWPSADMTVGACRALFRLADGAHASVRAFSLSFGDDEEATGIVSIDNGQLTIDNWVGAAWYDLQGRRLQGQPTKPGLYIHNGKKVVIK